MTETSRIAAMESKIKTLEELLSVSENSFLQESQKIEEINVELRREMGARERLSNDIKQILECSGDAIEVIDQDCNVIYANAAFLRLQNIAEKDLLNKKCYDVAPSDHCFTDECSLKRIIAEQKAYEREWQHEISPGNVVSYRLRYIPYYSRPGRLVGMIKKFSDITQEKQARIIAEENAQRQGRIEMTSDMLHDIGNALAGISLTNLFPQEVQEWTEIEAMRQLGQLFSSRSEEMTRLLGEEKNRALHSFIEALIVNLQERKSRSHEAANALAASINHIRAILDLHRYYAREKASARTAVVSIRQLLDDALVILSDSLKKRNIRIRVESTGERPEISGDRTRLMRMFLNVIKNIYEAFDQIPASAPRALDIDVSASLANKEVTVIFVDNAIGFSPEVGEKLFERGFTTKSGGSGIGLPECRSIVQSHGGSIAVESRGLNTGATITIKFPLMVGKQES